MNVVADFFRIRYITNKQELDCLSAENLQKLAKTGNLYFRKNSSVGT